MNRIECPACGREKHHTVYCGIYKDAICQTHCNGCPYRENSFSLSQCNYRREMQKHGVLGVQ